MYPSLQALQDQFFSAIYMQLFRKNVFTMACESLVYNDCHSLYNLGKITVQSKLELQQVISVSNVSLCLHHNNCICKLDLSLHVYVVCGTEGVLNI